MLDIKPTFPSVSFCQECKNLDRLQANWLTKKDDFVCQNYQWCPGTSLKKMTGETPEIRSDKRKPREKKEREKRDKREK